MTFKLQAMSRKWVLLLLFSVFTAGFAHAQDDTEELSENPNLKAIDQRVDQPEALKGQFTQEKYLKVLSKPLTSNGYFIVVKNQGIVWQVEKPVASRLVITPDQTRFSEANSARVAQSMQYIGKIFNHVLAGDLSALQHQFAVEKATINDNGWDVVLKPRSLIMQKAINSIDIHGNKLIEGLTLNEATGDKTIITFADQQTFDKAPEGLMHAFSQ